MEPRINSSLDEFIRVFEEEGFLPWVISPNYTGSFNPFDILAELELKSQ